MKIWDDKRVSTTNLIIVHKHKELDWVNVEESNKMKESYKCSPSFSYYNWITPIVSTAILHDMGLEHYFKVGWAKVLVGTMIPNLTISCLLNI